MLLFYSAGNYVKHKEMFCSASEKFNENSFALVQCGYLLVNKKIIRKEPKQEFDDKKYERPKLAQYGF